MTVASRNTSWKDYLLAMWPFYTGMAITSGLIALGASYFNIVSFSSPAAVASYVAATVGSGYISQRCVGWMGNLFCYNEYKRCFRDAYRTYTPERIKEIGKVLEPIKDLEVAPEGRKAQNYIIKCANKIADGKGITLGELATLFHNFNVVTHHQWVADKQGQTARTLNVMQNDFSAVAGFDNPHGLRSPTGPTVVATIAASFILPLLTTVGLIRNVQQAPQVVPSVPSVQTTATQPSSINYRTDWARSALAQAATKAAVGQQESLTALVR